MANGQGLPAPPDVTVAHTGEERALGALGGVLSAGAGRDMDQSPLVQAMNKHHQQQVDIAQKHYNDWKTYTGILATGNNPDTGQPLTAEESEKYYNLRQATGDALDKTAGVNKDIKDKLSKVKMIGDHLIHLHPKNLGADAGQPGPDGQPQPAPGQSGMPPPPGWREHAQAQMDQHHEEINTEFAQWKKMQDVLRENKIAENEALAKARQSGQRAPRPVGSMSTSILDARKMVGQGKIFKSYSGEPIDVDSLDDSMGLKGMLVWNPAVNDFEPRYEPFSPNQSTITVGNEVIAVSPMDKSKIGAQGAGTDLGKHNTGSTTATTDPATNQTTVAKHTPNTPGVAGRGGLPAPPVASTGGGGTPSLVNRGGDSGQPTSAPLAPAQGDAGQPRTGSKISNPALPALDDQGHIPNTVQGYSPQVIEGANELMDDKDIKDLPAKTKMLSGQLARKYGWEQGKFTPLQQTQLREATTFLEQAIKSPAMSVLDESTWQRFKTGQANKDTDKENMVGQFFTTLAAKNLTPKQAEFKRINNQLVGTISGLSSLVRSGRATEANIDRLKKELFNVYNSKDSADGKAQLQRLLDEVNVAMKKGRFMGVGEKSKGLPKPPSTGAKSVDDEIMELVGAARKPN